MERKELDELIRSYLSGARNNIVYAQGDITVANMDFYLCEALRQLKKAVELAEREDVKEEYQPLITRIDAAIDMLRLFIETVQDLERDFHA